MARLWRHMLVTAVLLALLVTSVLTQNCYYPDGSLSVSDYACSSDVGVCCPLNWECLSNGLCYLSTEDYYGRYTCTDATWESDSCPDLCVDNTSEGGDEALLQCSNGQWCCDHNRNASNVCCDQADTDYFSLPSGSPMASISTTYAVTSAPSSQASAPPSTVVISSVDTPISSSTYSPQTSSSPTSSEQSTVVIYSVDIPTSTSTYSPQTSRSPTSTESSTVVISSVDTPISRSTSSPTLTTSEYFLPTSSSTSTTPLSTSTASTSSSTSSSSSTPTIPSVYATGGSSSQPSTVTTAEATTGTNGQVSTVYVISVPTDSPAPHSSSSHVGLIAGTAVGIPVVFLAGAIALCLLWRRRRSRHRRGPAEPATYSDRFGHQVGHIPPEGRTSELDSHPVAMTRTASGRTSELPGSKPWRSSARLSRSPPPGYTSTPMSPELGFVREDPAELWGDSQPPIRVT